jgi:hypothetical protein
MFNNLIILKIHAGYFAEPVNNPFGNDFRCDEGNKLDSIFQVSETIPKGLINRSKFGSAFVAKLGPSAWQQKISELAQRPPSAFTIYVKPFFNISTNSFNVKTYLKFRVPFSNDLKIGLYLVEDSIQNWQLDYSVQPPQVPDYVHRQVLRDGFFPINNSDFVIPSPFFQGQVLERQWFLPLRSGINRQKCKVIVVAYDPVSYEIFQAVEVKILD